MRPLRDGWFAFFVVSGFCSLVYEIVWLRLAMAAFGMVTPFVSIVLSVFMAGLALGSWLGGRIALRERGRDPSRETYLYALAEAVIGASGLLVPVALESGRTLLERAQGDASWSGSGYLLVSGAWITLVLLPGCIAMGATFPLAMAAIRKRRPSERSFSFLYVANVLGATLGTLASAFVLIELLGFRGTLLVAAASNAALVAGALLLAKAVRREGDETSLEQGRSALSAAALDTPAADARPTRSFLGLLFATGLLSMAMEVVWVRQFTPYLGTFVYAFALILSTYLLATFLGSVLYRTLRASRGLLGGTPWAVAGLLALLPLYASDPRAALAWKLPESAFRLWIGTAPIAGAFGYLTPMLVDRWSRGDPARAGKAYAVNVVGCILGPLIAGFVLLPLLGERWTIVVLGASLLAIALGPVARRGTRSAERVAFAVCAAAALALVGATRAFETQFPEHEVRRDATATTVALGEGRGKRLFVNGISMTGVTPLTKVMVHLPMAWRADSPRDVLVICFGMGTSFRSALSWGASCTAVELVPSVPELFSYFHPDGEALAARLRGRVVVDDGRRYLERTSEQFDMITVDPPPPIEAAGSSLLYSREFYRVVKRRLRPGGILQQWFPGRHGYALAAATRSVKEEFPHVIGFISLDDYGVHFLASEAPLLPVTPALLASRLPPDAATDFVEWGPEATAEKQFRAVLARKTTLPEPARIPAPALIDDRPVNEYFLLRSWFGVSSAVVADDPRPPRR